MKGVSRTGWRSSEGAGSERHEKRGGTAQGMANGWQANAWVLGRVSGGRVCSVETVEGGKQRHGNRGWGGRGWGGDGLIRWERASALFQADRWESLGAGARRAGRSEAQ